MGFADLLLDDALIVMGEDFPHTIGTSFAEPLSIIDTDDTLLDLSTGYTAAMTLNLPDSTNVLAFTQTVSGGRIIDLNPAEDCSLFIRSTPAGMNALAPYVDQRLAFNLIVTHTASGLAAAVMRRCFIVPTPAYD